MRREIFLLEVSGSQQCFHIGEIDELITKNLKYFYERRACLDYVPIFMGTRDECQRAASKLEPLLQSMRCGDDLKRARVH